MKSCAEKLTNHISDPNVSVSTCVATGFLLCPRKARPRLLVGSLRTCCGLLQKLRKLITTHGPCHVDSVDIALKYPRELYTVDSVDLLSFFANFCPVTIGLSKQTMAFMRCLTPENGTSILCGEHMKASL